MHQQKKQRSGRREHSKSNKPQELSRLSFQKILQRYNAGLFQEAETLLESHLKRYPEDDAAINISGLIAYQFRQYESAIELFRSAISLNDRECCYYNSLGAAMKESGDLKGAIPCFQKALDLNPDYSYAAYNLGNSYHALKELSLAMEWYNYALDRDPDYHKAYNGKACAYKEQGMIKEAIEVFQQATQRKLYDALFDSNYLLCLNYLEEIDPESVFRHHLEWAARHASKENCANHNYSNDAIPTRRLRVGYLSADYRAHPVAFFMNPVLIGHDRRKIEVYCYADVASPDEMTKAMMPNAEHWKRIHGMSDDQVFQCIQKDCIDILVDLGGHTANNRMRLFSRKPAPIQVSYLGYPNTTGLQAMDYRITDAIADPQGMTDRYYTEKLIRLPEGFLCYQPSTGCPEITLSPCLENGYITFGSFSNRVKINSKVVAVWSDLLMRIPYSRLILKSSMEVDDDARQRLLSLFVEKGIAASRVEILPYLPFLEHLKQYQRVDIALDTFPYNGTTTTLEALWMGVPVVTLSGNTHVSRVGASILSHLGLDEWIISSIDDYAKRSAMLADDIENLQYLRRSLRVKLKNSSLMDQKRFAVKLEAAYRRMWFDRCANLISDGCERSDVTDVRMQGDIAVCVPSDTNCMTSYILMEYQNWFEREIAIIRTFLKPGMNGMDIGAGYGVYALAAAKSVGPSGKLWAFEPSRLTAAYLARSIRCNQLDNITVVQAGVSETDSPAFLSINIRSELDRIIDFEASDIKEAVTLTHLDGWMQHLDARIDFMRLDPQGQEDDIIRGGTRFFECFSPLILYKIKHGGAFHPEMIRSFLNIGYQSYRLIPGLKILAPVSIGERLDAFQLNLFCCKEDCAETLQQQGLLQSGKEDGLTLHDVPASLWIEYLQDFPYVVRFLPLWQAFCVKHVADADWRTHQQALSAYAMSQLPAYSVSVRYAALIQGYGLMSGLLKSQPTVSRILTTIRIANDLGYQEDAVTWLNHLYHFFESAHEFSLDEPFLAVSGRMAVLDPGNDIGQWLIYGVLETRELCQAFSSYFTGKNALPNLNLMRTSPFYSDEMERRRQLILDRFGMKSDVG